MFDKPTMSDYQNSRKSPMARKMPPDKRVYRFSAMGAASISRFPAPAPTERKNVCKRAAKKGSQYTEKPAAAALSPTPQASAESTSPNSKASPASSTAEPSVSHWEGLRRNFKGEGLSVCLRHP